MKKIIFLLIAALAMLPGAMSAKNNSKDAMPEYEITSAGSVANQGTYLVKVTVITKDKNLERNELKRAAVHGVLFRGFDGKKPLAGSASAEAAHQDFFNSFFMPEGPSKGYATEVPGSRKTIKSDKKYKTSATMTVQKDQLQRDLEKEGVIRGLNSIF